MSKPLGIKVNASDGYCYGPYTDAVRERFWSKVDKSGECWMWLGRVDNWGYGRGYVARGSQPAAHRMVYEMEIGPIPPLMLVDHTCRARLCVRPEHLRVVTDAQNKQNLSTKAGNRSGHRGVSWDQVNQKWRATCFAAGKQHSAGRHDTIEEAAAAALAKRLEVLTHSDPEARAAAWGESDVAKAWPSMLAQ